MPECVTVHPPARCQPYPSSAARPPKPNWRQPNGPGGAKSTPVGSGRSERAVRQTGADRGVHMSTRPFVPSRPAASEDVEKEDARGHPATTLTTGRGMSRGEEKEGNRFYSPCNYGDAEGLSSPEADSCQGMWDPAHTHETGLMPGGLWPQNSIKEVCVPPARGRLSGFASRRTILKTLLNIY